MGGSVGSVGMTHVSKTVSWGIPTAHALNFKKGGLHRQLLGYVEERRGEKRRGEKRREAERRQRREEEKRGGKRRGKERRGEKRRGEKRGEWERREWERRGELTLRRCVREL